MKRRHLTEQDITPTTSLRLDDAARLGFPDGSATIWTLRREIAKGRLTAWRIGGKDMTSLAEIELMKERCRVKANPSAYGSGPSVETRPEMSSPRQSTSSSTMDSISPQDAFAAKLRLRKQGSPTTSNRSTRRLEKSETSRLS